MKKVLFLITILCFIQELLVAQNSILAAIAVADDGIAFVAGEAIANGTIVYYTDNEYSDANDNFNSGESVWEYTAPSGGISKGDVVSIVETSANNFDITCTAGSGSGTCGTFIQITGDFDLDNTSEEYYLYSDSDSDPTNGVSQIYSAVGVDGLGSDENPKLDHPGAIIIDDLIAGLGVGTDVEFSKSIRQSEDVEIADLEDLGKWEMLSGGVPSTSNFCCINLVLPIELISFEAKPIKDQVQLTWKTALEINNQGFEIQKSRDAKNWDVLSFVKGNGTTFQEQDYIFIDRQPFEDISYYRIKQLDYDGKFELSFIVSAVFRGSSSILKIAPNPVKNGELNVELNSKIEMEDFRLNIYNQIGVLAKMHTNKVYAKKYQEVLSLRDLNKGIYFVEIIVDNQIFFKRIIVD